MKLKVLIALGFLALSTSVLAVGGSGVDALGTRSGGPVPGCSAGVPMITDSSGNLACAGTYSGNDIENSTITLGTNSSGAVETAGRRQVYSYSGTNSQELSTGLWIDYYYSQSGAVGTAHGVGLFVRNHGALTNTNFQAAIEGNTLCTSTQPFAYCGSGIFHTKGDTQASGVSFPQASLFFGVDLRVDITSDGFGVTPSTSGTVIFIRPDPGSIGGMPGERFGYYTTDKDIQIINAGNILKIHISSAATGGGTLDVHQACGGSLVLTSTGSITMNAVSFTAPSLNTTNGTYNDDCEVTVQNFNLVANRTITFVHSLTSLNTTTAANIVVGAFGGAFRMTSNATAGAWNQTTIVTQGNR